MQYEGVEMRYEGGGVREVGMKEEGGGGVRVSDAYPLDPEPPHSVIQYL